MELTTKTLTRTVVVLFLAVVPTGLQAQESRVYITEFMAGNDAVLCDDDERDSANGPSDPDWIELFNNTGAEVDLTNWSLTDEPNINPRRWVFPNVKLQPGEYMIVYLSGKWFEKSEPPYNIARAPSEPGLHTSFRLSQYGEVIRLSDQDGNPVEEHSFGRQVRNSSLGWKPDFSRTGRLDRPTPGKPNDYNMEIPPCCLGSCDE